MFTWSDNLLWADKYRSRNSTNITAYSTRQREFDAVWKEKNTNSSTKNTKWKLKEKPIIQNN